MANPTVRFEGVEDCCRRLEDIERRVLNKGLKEAYMDAAEIVRAEAERRAPVGATGALRRSMVTFWDGKRRRAKVGPSKDAHYGIFQEIGTSRHAAQPFLRPALAATSSQVGSVIGKKLKSIIEER